MLSGQNGILNKSIEAREKILKAQEEENNILKSSQMLIDIKSAYNKKPLNDDENIELKDFIARYKIEEESQTIKFPVGGTAQNLIIDYGDGVIEEKEGYINGLQHTYEKGEYIVKFKGKCNSFSYFNLPADKDKIYEFIQWGTVFNEHIDFANCNNLSGNIPTPTTNTMKEIIDASRMFKNTAVSGQIPPYLFYGGENIEKAHECFSGCKNLESIIPETLFQYSKKLESINAMFSDSAVLGEIPAGLFANNKELENITYIFSGCNGIYGRIPGNLFSNNTKIKSFRGVFRGCSINTVGEELFFNNTLVTDFVNLFRECENLEYVPEKLFFYNTEVTQFNDCFRDCINLKKISTNLFINNNKVVDYTETFYNCLNLEGNGITLWEKNQNIIGNQCFRNCKKLNNYELIPESWK